MNALKELEKLRKKNMLEIYSLRYENEKLKAEIIRDNKEKRNRKLREKRYAAKNAPCHILKIAG